MRQLYIMRLSIMGCRGEASGSAKNGAKRQFSWSSWSGEEDIVEGHMRGATRQDTAIKLASVCCAESTNDEDHWNCAVFVRDTTQLTRLTN